MAGSVMEHRSKLESVFRHLKTGDTYCVAKAFRDYDLEYHAEGEEWLFIGSNFVPYDDGLSLFASINGVERQVRLQWREEEQADIIDNLETYFLPHA
jgi:hypothetical protein